MCYCPEKKSHSYVSCPSPLNVVEWEDCDGGVRGIKSCGKTEGSYREELFHGKAMYTWCCMDHNPLFKDK